MNILHITPAFYPATYWGGPIYSTYGLCNALAKLGRVKLRVLTTDSCGPRIYDRLDVEHCPALYPSGYEVYFCRRILGASISLGMLGRLAPLVRWADVVHLTGVYSAPTIPALIISHFFQKPLVWSPRGAFLNWGQRVKKPLAKSAWGKLCNALIGTSPCVLHATSNEEVMSCQGRVRNASISLIPNGVEVPEELPKKEWLPNGQIRILYMGRLHPIKGIERLIEALALLRHESFCLNICGDGHSLYAASLRNLVRRLDLEARITFHGHVRDAEKLHAYMESDVCVVPSFSENFGMVVVEALAHGIPVIASKGTPWAHLTKYGAGFWVDNRPEDLAAAITDIARKDLSVMGSIGRNWMREQFQWKSIATRMSDLYCAIA